MDDGDGDAVVERRESDHGPDASHSSYIEKDRGWFRSSLELKAERHLLYDNKWIWKASTHNQEEER